MNLYINLIIIEKGKNMMTEDIKLTHMTKTAG